MLSSDRKCPANAAMDYYFEETGSKRYRGRPRTTIFTTLEDKIKRTVEKTQSFSVKSLKRSVNRQRVRELSQEILLLTFTRLLKTRNHKCVTSN